MAGDAQVRDCSTRSAEPCVASPAAQDAAENERGCTLTLKPAARKELAQAGEVATVAGDMAHDFNNLLTIITTYTRLVLEDLEPDDPSRSDLEQVCQAAERARELTRDLRALEQRHSSVVLST
jgi:signal transduction histidine kinase